jgi:hypothetical protein
LPFGRDVGLASPTLRISPARLRALSAKTKNPRNKLRGFF